MIKTIKTNGKHIGINANPETDYDFVLTNIRPPFRKLLRGLDLYNYVMSLPDTTFKKDITNSSGKVTGYYYISAFRSRYPDNLRYCTDTDKYVNAALYSYTARDTGFNTLYANRKTTSSKTNYRVINIDLSKAQGYEYICIFSKHNLSPLTADAASLQLSHALSYDTTYPNNNMKDMYIKSYNIKSYGSVSFLCKTSDEFEIYVIATNNDMAMLKAFNTAVDTSTYETVGNKVLDVDKFFITI